MYSSSEQYSCAAFDDGCWLAVPNTNAAQLVDILSLRKAVPVSWQEAWDALADDYWNRTGTARTFISPQVSDWTLVIGSWLWDVDVASRLCQMLSRRFGFAHQFCVDGQSDSLQWILAKEGTIFRRFGWQDGEPLFDEGEPVQAEKLIWEQFQNNGAFDSEQSEDEIRSDFYYIHSVTITLSVAREWSIDPSTLLEEIAIGQGLLAYVDDSET